MAAKPEAGEEILRDNHSHSNHYSVGDAKFVIAGHAVAAEDGAADDGLQQIYHCQIRVDAKPLL